MEVPLVDPLTGEDLGIPLLGIVDLVLDDPDGPVVRDFKTSSRSAPPFEVTHEVQLTSYGYLFRRSTGLEEVGLEIHSLIKTKTPKIEGHRYPARTDAHFRRLFGVIRECLDALDRAHASPTDVDLLFFTSVTGVSAPSLDAMRASSASRYRRWNVSAASRHPSMDVSRSRPLCRDGRNERDYSSQVASCGVTAP